MNLKWSQVFDEWVNGNYPKIPSNINKPFFWRTSVIDNSVDLPYHEEFIEDERFLSQTRQDLKAFNEHFISKKNIDKKYAIHFPNLSSDTTLVVPVPKKGKNFINLFYFMKNASKIQQQELWKLVVKQAKTMLKKHKNIWISTHGLGVNYLHVRISNSPKYYENSKLQKIPKNK